MWSKMFALLAIANIVSASLEHLTGEGVLARTGGVTGHVLKVAQKSETWQAAQASFQENDESQRSQEPNEQERDQEERNVQNADFTKALEKWHKQ